MSMNVGTVVELAPDMGGFYKGAQPGCRGVIADAKKDDDGFDIIYVRWDRMYSVYTGPQEDGWCYPAHFIDVGSMTSEQYASRMIEKADEDCPDCGTSADERKDNFLAALHAATEDAQTADAFALLWVSRRDDPDEENEEIIQPKMTWESLTSVGQVLLKAHLHRVAAVMSNDLMLAEVNQVVDRKDS